MVNAIKYIDPDTQVVLCAGAPDTPEIAKEMEDSVNEVKKERDNVIWIDVMLEKEEVIELYSHADVFCCPSIYEPFGIINIEAMACETAVVASAVGGIKEVVVDGETGILVPPGDDVAMALAIESLAQDEERRQQMGAEAIKRARRE